MTCPILEIQSIISMEATLNLIIIRSFTVKMDLGITLIRILIIMIKITVMLAKT